MRVFRSLQQLLSFLSLLMQLLTRLAEVSACWYLKRLNRRVDFSLQAQLNDIMDQCSGFEL